MHKSTYKIFLINLILNSSQNFFIIVLSNETLLKNITKFSGAYLNSVVFKGLVEKSNFSNSVQISSFRFLVKKTNQTIVIHIHNFYLQTSIITISIQIICVYIYINNWMVIIIIL